MPDPFSPQTSNRTAFLDRDGIINLNAPDKGYVRSPEAFHFTPELLPFLKALMARGFEFVVVTNQQGIRFLKI